MLFYVIICIAYQQANTNHHTQYTSFVPLPCLPLADLTSLGTSVSLPWAAFLDPLDPITLFDFQVPLTMAKRSGHVVPLPA